MEEKTWLEIKEILEQYISQESEFEFEIEEIIIRRFDEIESFENQINKSDRHSSKRCRINPVTGKIEC